MKNICIQYFKRDLKQVFRNICNQVSHNPKDFGIKKIKMLVNEFGTKISHTLKKKKKKIKIRAIKL